MNVFFFLVHELSANVSGNGYKKCDLTVEGSNNSDDKTG